MHPFLLPFILVLGFLLGTTCTVFTIFAILWRFARKSQPQKTSISPAPTVAPQSEIEFEWPPGLQETFREQLKKQHTLDVVPLNLLLQRLFVIWRLDEALKTKLAQKLKSQITKITSKTGMINAVQITELGLGVQPPILHSVVMMPNQKEEDDLTLEVDLEYPGDGSIGITTHLSGGFEIPVHVVAGAFRGRVLVKLPAPGCITAMAVSFITDPGITFKVNSSLSHTDVSLPLDVLAPFMARKLRALFLELWLAPAYRLFDLPLLNTPAEVQQKIGAEYPLKADEEMGRIIDERVETWMEGDWKEVKRRRDVGLFKRRESEKDIYKGIFTAACEISKLYTILSSPEHLRHIDESFESCTLLKRLSPTLITRSYKYRSPQRSFTVLESTQIPNTVAYQSISSPICVLHATSLTAAGPNTIVTILSCHGDSRLEVSFTKLQKLKSFVEEFSALSARAPPNPSLYSSGKLKSVLWNTGVGLMRAGKDVIGRRRTGSISSGRPEQEFDDEEDVDDQIDETDPRFLRDSLGQLNESVNTKANDEDKALRRLDNTVQEMLAIKTWEGSETIDEVLMADYQDKVLYKACIPVVEDLRSIMSSPITFSHAFIEIFELIAPPIPPSARCEIRLAHSDRSSSAWLKYSETQVALSSDETGVMIWDLTEDFISLLFTKNDNTPVDDLVAGLRTLSVIAAAPLSRFFRPQYRLVTLPPNESIQHEVNCQSSLQFEYRTFGTPFRLWVSLTTHLPRIRCTADATPSFGILPTNGIQTLTFTNDDTRTHRLLLFSRIGKHPDTCIQLKLACTKSELLKTPIYLSLKEPCYIHWNLEGPFDTELHVERRRDIPSNLISPEPSPQDSSPLPRASSIYSESGAASLAHSEFSRSGSLSLLTPPNPARAKVSKKMITGDLRALSVSASIGSMQDHVSLNTEPISRDPVSVNASRKVSAESEAKESGKPRVQSDDKAALDMEATIILKSDLRKFGSVLASSGGIYDIKLTATHEVLSSRSESEYSHLSIHLSTRADV